MNQNRPYQSYAQTTPNVHCPIPHLGPTPAPDSAYQNPANQPPYIEPVDLGWLESSIHGLLYHWSYYNQSELRRSNVNLQLAVAGLAKEKNALEAQLADSQTRVIDAQKNITDLRFLVSELCTKVQQLQSYGWDGLLESSSSVCAGCLRVKTSNEKQEPLVRDYCSPLLCTPTCDRPIYSASSTPKAAQQDVLAKAVGSQ
jgi:hypothetical protein